MNIITMTFVAPNLACGKARGGSISRSGSVTDEQRRHRPNSAQPFGRQFFFGQTSLLAPHRPLKGLYLFSEAQPSRLRVTRASSPFSPREVTRPTRLPWKSACIVGPVPSPGVHFKGLLTGIAKPTEFLSANPREFSPISPCASR